MRWFHIHLKIEHTFGISVAKRKFELNDSLSKNPLFIQNIVQLR